MSQIPLKKDPVPQVPQIFLSVFPKGNVVIYQDDCAPWKWKYPNFSGITEDWL